MSAPRATPLLAGFAADLAFGDPQRFHPVAGFGQLALRLEALLYAQRRSAGAVYVGVLVGGAAALGRLLAGPGARLGSSGRGVPCGHGTLLAPFRRGALRAPLRRGAALAFTLWAALGGRSLAREAGRIGALVDADDLDGARERLPWLCGRDPSALDADGLCRAAIESLAENTVDAVVSPLLWARAGAPGVCAHRASNTLDAMVGHHSDRYEDFGWAAARLDDAMNWPGARVGAALTVACAPLAGGSASGARAMWKRDGALHPSPNGGHVEAAFAGALGVRLGGPVQYGPRVEQRPWLGDGPAPTPGDVRRAVALARLVALASALLAAAVNKRGQTPFARGGRA